MFLLFTGVCQAQSIEIREKEQEVNGVKRRGQQLVVQLDHKTVEKAWKEHLQGMGKVKTSRGVFTVEGAAISAVSEEPLQIISTVNSDALGSYVWWSLDTGLTYVGKSTTPAAYAAAEDLLRGFAKKLYRDDVLRQINEAEEVLRATKAEQERVVKEANSIQASIEKNRQHKLELEAALQRNAEELKQLEQNVQHNARQQELSRQRVQEMEQAVEAVRAKLSEIK